jgi:hypothetical protein
MPTLIIFSGFATGWPPLSRSPGPARPLEEREREASRRKTTLKAAGKRERRERNEKLPRIDPFVGSVLAA